MVKRKTKEQLLRELALERLRKFLYNETGCDIQHGWCCGTCFMDYLNKLGLDSTKEEYKKRNKPIERHNEVWRALLQVRGC